MTRRQIRQAERWVTGQVVGTLFGALFLAALGWMWHHRNG